MECIIHPIQLDEDLGRSQVSVLIAILEILPGLAFEGREHGALHLLIRVTLTEILIYLRSPVVVLESTFLSGLPEQGKNHFSGLLVLLLLGIRSPDSPVLSLFLFLPFLIPVSGVAPFRAVCFITHRYGSRRGVAGEGTVFLLVIICIIMLRVQLRRAVTLIFEVRHTPRRVVIIWASRPGSHHR